MGSHPQVAVSSPERIAIFRALQLGDMLLAVPALRAIRRQYPGASITLIGLPWAESFANRYSYFIDSFLEFPGFPGIVEAPYIPERTRRFVDDRRREPFDVVVQMHGSGERSNEFALAMNSRRTVGYYVDVPPSPSFRGTRYPTETHEILRNLGLAELMGCTHLSAQLEFPLTSADRHEARNELSALPTERGPLVVIHPGARASSRRWAPGRFAEVADCLIEELGARVAVTGSAEEALVACEVLSTMKHRALDLTGRTSLGGLAALVAEADLFIGNDSGPAHLAGAVGTNSVVIFGPEDPVRWGSLEPGMQAVVRREVECSPCHLAVCPIDHRCMAWLEAEAVSRTAMTLLHAPLEVQSSPLSELVGAHVTEEAEWIA